MDILESIKALELLEIQMEEAIAALRKLKNRDALATQNAKRTIFLLRREIKAMQTELGIGIQEQLNNNKSFKKKLMEALDDTPRRRALWDTF